MYFHTQWVLCFVTFVTCTSVTFSDTFTAQNNIIQRKELFFKRCHNLAELKNANLTLDCAGNDIIAIHLAYFSTVFPEDCSLDNSFSPSNNEEENLNSLNSNFYSGCTEDIRLTLNSFCSGSSNCTLDLSSVTSYFENCDSFSNGWINVHYTCVSEKHRSKFCQQHFSAPFGYLSTPGYPSYYSPFECRWSIQAEPGQRVHLQIIDLAIREPNSLPLASNRRRKPGEPSEKCLDALNIIDQDVKIQTLCGERNSNLIEYRSLGEALSIEFIPKGFSPSRGILMKYSLVNCTNLRAPANGYGQRNGSFAYYSCNFDQVFENTGLQDLVLYCVDNYYWNGSVPRCVAPTEHEDLLDSQRAKLASSIITNLTSGLGGIDNTFQGKHKQNNEAYAQLNRSLWVTVILIAITIIVIFIIFQCISVNLKSCFNRAGNYRIDEEPVNV